VCCACVVCVLCVCVVCVLCVFCVCVFVCVVRVCFVRVCCACVLCVVWVCVWEIERELCLVTRSAQGLRSIGDRSFAEFVALMESYIQRKTELLGEKCVPVLLCSPQIPRELAWDRNRTSAKRRRHLTAWTKYAEGVGGGWTKLRITSNRNFFSYLLVQNKAAKDVLYVSVMNLPRENRSTEPSLKLCSAGVERYSINFL
jgi:hypothetical protein